MTKDNNLAIHPTAIIDSKAQLDSSVEVGPFCVIDGNVRVAAGCRLMQNVYLTGWTEIGSNAVIHPGAIVGHEPQDVKYDGAKTYCRIGNHAIIREHVTIHRGTIPDSATVVGNDCFLLAGAHVGHNCQLGDRVTLINNVMLAGHVTVGSGVTMGGGAAVHQFVRIGDLAMIAGFARVGKDVLPYALVDEAGDIAGINRVGLKRAEFSREDIHAIREVYRVLFDSGLSREEAIDRLNCVEKHPRCAALLSFVVSDSKRGLAGRPR